MHAQAGGQKFHNFETSGNTCKALGNGFPILVIIGDY